MESTKGENSLKRSVRRQGNLIQGYRCRGKLPIVRQLIKEMEDIIAPIGVGKSHLVEVRHRGARSVALPDIKICPQVPQANKIQ